MSVLLLDGNESADSKVITLRILKTRIQTFEE
jgi:hypothetical protein